MLLRVNFVGVGRLAIAVTSDVGMGISRSVKRSQRIKLQEEQILLLGAKVYYKQAGMWIAAENTGETLEEAYNMMEKTTEIFARSVDDVKDSLNNIGEMVPAIEEKNRDLLMILRIFLSGGKEAEYGSKKIAIVCDGKEISYALNLLHLFQYKNEIEEFNSDNYKGSFNRNVFCGGIRPCQHSRKRQ